MNSISSFSLGKHEGPYEQWPARTPLFFDGRPTGTSLEGYDIDAQFKMACHYLLILNYDCPFEEASHFVLLGADFSEQGSLRLGQMYESFLLSSATPESEHSLLLRYGHNLCYRLTVRPDRGLFRRCLGLKMVGCPPRP